MKLVHFAIPATLDDARETLCQLGDDGIAAAGCTAFHFYTKADEKKAVLLTQTGINGIQSSSDSFTIGAATSLSQLLHETSNGWVLNRVAREIASHQIRNISTIGGNIARVFPWADLPVALLALGGSVTITGDTERTLSMDDYFKSQPAALFQAGDILTSVEIPALKQGAGFGHIKQRMKSEAFSLSTASARIVLEGGKVSNARIAIGASIAFPTRLTALEDAITSNEASSVEETLTSTTEQAFADLKFLKKEGMSPDYIRNLTIVSVADAVLAALKEAQGGAA